MNKIKVFIADDNPYAIEGLAIILEARENLELIGQSENIEYIFDGLSETEPNILLIDMLWGSDENAGANVIKRVRNEFPNVKIIAITAFEKLIEIALQSGAHDFLLKTYDVENLYKLIYQYGMNNKVTAEYYSKQLNNLEKGKNNAYIYERLMFEILTFIFSECFSNADFQSTTLFGTRRRDILFLNNRTDHQFWKMVHDKFGAILIVIELKNTDPTGDHIDDVQKYFGKHIGNFGILIARTKVKKNVSTRQLSLYHLQDRLILVMSDLHIHNMLRYKAAGADPIFIIEELYNDFIKKIQ